MWVCVGVLWVCVLMIMQLWELGKVNSMNGCMDQSAGHSDLLTLQVCCAVGIGEGSRTAVTDTEQ